MSSYFTSIDLAVATLKQRHQTPYVTTFCPPTVSGGIILTVESLLMDEAADLGVKYDPFATFVVLLEKTRGIYKVV